MTAAFQWLIDTTSSVTITALGIMMLVHYVCTLGFMPKSTPLLVSAPVVGVVAASAGMVACAMTDQILFALYFALTATIFCTAFNIILWLYGYHVSKHFNQHAGQYELGEWTGPNRRNQSLVPIEVKRLDHKQNAFEALTGSAGIFLLGFVTIPLVAALSGAQVSMLQGAKMGFLFFIGRIGWLFANRTWHAMRLERK